MPLPNFAFNPYIGPYAGSPTEEFTAVLDSKIQDYDVAVEHSDALQYQADILTQQVLPNDVNYARGIMSNTRKNIDEWAQSGDYENMGRQIKKGAREFSQQAAPVLQRSGQYSEYVKGIKENKDVDEDTKRKSIAFSVQNDRGYDPNDPSTHSFSGYAPSKTVNVSEKLDKYIQGMAANGGIGDITFSPDGVSYTTKKWKELTAEEIGLAADQFLRGDSEAGSYIQTQYTIGNQPRVDREIGNAIAAVQNKYSFKEISGDFNWIPKHILDAAKAKEELGELTRSIGGIGDNIYKNDPLDGAKLDITGNLGVNNDYYTHDPKTGGYTKIVNANGKTLSRQEVANAVSVVKDERAKKLGRAAGIIPEDQLLTTAGLKVIPATAVEQKKYVNSVNKVFDEIVLNTFMEDYEGVLWVPPPNATHNQRMEVARGYMANRSPQQIAEYRAEVKARHDEAKSEKFSKIPVLKLDKYFATDVKTVGGMQISDKGVLATGLSGRPINQIGSAIEGLELVPEADINDLQKALAEEEWAIESMVDRGVTEGNPVGRTIGSVISVKLKGIGDNKDNSRDMIITAGISPYDKAPALQKIQEYMGLVFSGNSHDIPKLDGSGTYRVISTPVKLGSDKKIAEGQIPLRQRVIEMDKAGNIIANMPADAFFDHLIKSSVTAQDELKRYIINKTGSGDKID